MKTSLKTFFLLTTIISGSALAEDYIECWNQPSGTQEPKIYITASGSVLGGRGEFSVYLNNQTEPSLGPATITAQNVNLRTKSAYYKGPGGRVGAWLIGNPNSQASPSVSLSVEIPSEGVRAYGVQMYCQGAVSSEEK